MSILGLVLLPAKYALRGYFDFMGKEIWKDIEGYEGLYQVSSTGKVKSYNNKSGKPYIMSPGFDGRYLFVIFQIKGDKHRYKVHRLVATYFVPNPENKPQVNHKDGNKLNNNDWNLEWNTCKENIQHAWRTGLKTQKKGKESPYNISVKQFTKEGLFIKKWYSMQEIQDTLGFRKSHICYVCKGKLKTAYGFLWEYDLG